MAGIGVKLNNIYGKRTLTTNIIGMGYSTVMTIAPMLTVIGALCIMEHFLGFDSVGYATRELFSCTVLYIFIFSLLQHRRSTLYYPSTCRISFMRKPLRISFRVTMSG